MGDQRTGWGWQASHQSRGTQAACAAALPAQHSEELILDTAAGPHPSRRKQGSWNAHALWNVGSNVSLSICIKSWYFILFATKHTGSFASFLIKPADISGKLRQKSSSFIKCLLIRDREQERDLSLHGLYHTDSFWEKGGLVLVEEGF